ncbi:MAG: hypothetical protein H7326_03145 [Bdellovibrionaceae bacterium]|nr:hypothetical protein [Pseudobdellovibrionaceae bacterium]
MSYLRLPILSLLFCGTLLFAAKTVRAQTTEGNARCINCEMEAQNSRKTPNQEEMSAFAKKLMDNYNASKKAAAKKQIPCVGCGQIESGKNGKVILSATTDDVWGKFPEVMSYSGSDKVQKMIDTALTNSSFILGEQGRPRLRKKASFDSTGWCLRYVKKALVGSGVTDGYIGGRFVNRPVGNMLKILKGSGFKNLLDDPKYNDIIANTASAPKGAILVYSGGANGGHMEIKTEFGNTGTYVSDYQQKVSVIQNPLGGRASRSYKLIGVMIKPGV